MKIALLTDGIYPFSIGGMQKHSFFLIKYLSKNKIFTDVYCRDNQYNKEDFFALFTDNEKRYISLNYVKYPLLPYFPGHYLATSYLYSKKIYSKFKKDLMVDFIYAQGFTGWELVKKKKNGETLPPIGINFHGLEMYQIAPSFRSKLEQYMFRPFVSYNLRNADAAFSLGGNLNNILECIGVDKNNIYLSPNGVEEKWCTDSIKKPEEKRHFLFIGRYERRKGIEELHTCLKKMEKYQDKFTFHFVGPIPDHLKLHLPNIKYWGVIKDEEEMRSIFRQCDILVCPSYSEGMPTVILEAMASGLAVIATDVGAVKIMVSEENGWLIKPGDEDSLLKSMQDACEVKNDDLMNMKTNGRDLFKKNYSWNKVIETTINSIINHHVR